jgi:hypothetical protein
MRAQGSARRRVQKALPTSDYAAFRGASERSLALTILACTQMVHGQRPVFELLGRPDGAHPIP